MSESKSEIGKLAREAQDCVSKIRQAFRNKKYSLQDFDNFDTAEKFECAFLSLDFLKLHIKITECMNAQAELELEPQLAKTVRDLRDKRNFDLIDGTSIWNFNDVILRFSREKKGSEEIVVEKEPPYIDVDKPTYKYLVEKEVSYDDVDELTLKYWRLEDEEDLRDQRRTEAGTVIVTRKLPESVKKNLRVVKDLYAYGMFEAVTIYCRALLEASIDDAVDRQGWHSQDHQKQNVTAITNTKRGDTLSVLLSEHGRKLFENSFTDRIRKTVQSRANSILHFKDRLYEEPPEPISSQEALEQIKLTHEVIVYR